MRGTERRSRFLQLSRREFSDGPKERKSQGDTERSRGVTAPGEARAPVDATFPDAGILYPPPRHARDRPIRHSPRARAPRRRPRARAARSGRIFPDTPPRPHSPDLRPRLPRRRSRSSADILARRFIASGIRLGVAPPRVWRAAAEGDGAGDRDEDSGQSSVAEAETNAADDADSYNVAEEMPDTIPYKSRDSADEEDDDDDIELPGPGANAEAVKPAKGKDRACAFFPCSVPFAHRVFLVALL